jgi:hypothetical protein
MLLDLDNLFSSWLFVISMNSWYLDKESIDGCTYHKQVWYAFHVNLNILDIAEFGDSFPQILYSQSCWAIRNFNIYSFSLWCIAIPSLVNPTSWLIHLPEDNLLVADC